MIIKVDQTVPVSESYAAERTRGLYNVDADDGSRFQLEADIPADQQDWQIGVIVGPSGSGKTSILRRLQETGWKEWTGGRWAKDKPIIEVLGKADYAKATAALASVGLGSVPSWLRPRQVLSMGEGFRADLAALLLLSDAPKVVVDEFTSVLDRQVAQVGAGAFAKSWRRQEGRQVVLITPHYDVLEWLQPDWVLDTATADQLGGGVVLARKGDFQAPAHGAQYPGDEVGALVL